MLERADHGLRISPVRAASPTSPVVALSTVAKGRMLKAATISQSNQRPARQPVVSRIQDC
jgi:hypothetical protein